MDGCGAYVCYFCAGGGVGVDGVEVVGVDFIRGRRDGCMDGRG